MKQIKFFSALFLSLPLLLCSPANIFAGNETQTLKHSNTQTLINPEDVTIVRDSFGVPHIYGKTDADAAYGLAYATAEDDFQTMQLNLLSGKGMLGQLKGKQGATIDYVAKMLRIQEIVDEKYEKDLSPSFKKVLEGFAEGVNAYAKHHPEEVLIKKAFPVSPKDIVKNYIFSMSMMSGLEKRLKSIMNGSIETEETDMRLGSNSYAVNSKKSADGGVYFVLNSHQPLEGQFSWYEAHITSDEGWNALGGLFPGGVSIFSGCNENLAWAHTVNKLNLVDAYKLELDPKNKLRYKVDGVYQTLEVKKARLKVKLKMGLMLPVTKKTYWSIYGPTMVTKKGTYSIRYGANTEVRTAEEWFRMSKARNLDEFSSALNMQAISRMNIIYADRNDNLYYLCNGLVPVRDTTVCWKSLMPGNTRKNIWTKYYPVEKLPQVLNPPCGYIFNMNNAPSNCTGRGYNLNPNDYPAIMGLETNDNNRSIRFMEQIEQFDKLTYEQFKQLKYDMRLPEKSVYMDSLKAMFRLSPQEYPELAGSLEELNKWDRNFDPDNKAATLFSLTIKYLSEEMHFRTGPFYTGLAATNNQYATALKKAQDHLLKYFNTIAVPLGELQRHIRGNVDLPIGGFPDVLAAMFAKDYKNGRMHSFVGDSYIEFVRFNKGGGLPEIETVNAYGASNKADSPHYTDQMKLYVNHQTKKMSLDRKEVFSRAERIYHPY